MREASNSITPPPVTCGNCGGAWPRLWVVRREIEQCPSCRADLALESAAEPHPRRAASASSG
jgi:hypothetical protein